MPRLATRFLFVCLALSFELNPFAHWLLKADDSAQDFSANDLEFFEKKVRPILVNRCYECHSAESKLPKGGLRVDSRAALLAGGDTGPAIVPGSASKSLLVDAINYGETYQMPPKSRLPASEVVTLTKWVDRGAPWPKETPRTVQTNDTFDLAARKESHWCWQPIKKNSPPAVRNTAWPRQNLDHFILAKLEENGLPPSPPANPQTLLRRVYFDLLGMPPTVEQTQDFLNDTSPQAFESVVDQLLRSPHFGERWARHWMDVVRYAETCGHEFDYPIHHAWRYRDYLIRALNADVPYDQFVVEQIAGDLLPNPRLHPTEGFHESIIGTGFWWLHEALHAPVDVRIDSAGRIDNQIDVFAKTFLGLTVACARCHDHKFDAIATKDYYALAGFLKSTRRQEALLDPGGRIRVLVNQLRAARTDYQTDLQRCARDVDAPNVQQFSQLLLASREVLFGEQRSGDPAPAAGQRRSIPAVAREFHLSQETLKVWLAAVMDPQLRESDHPLHAWWKLALSSSTPPDEAAFNHYRKEMQRTKSQFEAEQAEYQAFAHFSNETFDGWKATGEAFDISPLAAGEWDVLAGGLQVAADHVAHSGQLSPKLQGVLRSPTFTIGTRNIFYRVAGQGCEVRLIIDGYTMIEFQQLLFSGCKFQVNTQGKWIWHKQSGDLGMYQGHRAYIEVIDHGDGWCALDQVCFSNRDTPPQNAPSDALISVAQDPAIDSLEVLAARLAREWQATIDRWRTNQLTKSDIGWVNWALAHECFSKAPLPDPGSSTRSSGSAAELKAAYDQEVNGILQDLPQPLRVTAALDGSGENERIFIRGNPRTLGDEAPRQLLVALAGEQPAIHEGSGRLILAQQIANPNNPLTARVLVNRVWHHLFGAGIVPSTDNFGVLGEVPSHPELLDHLAHQFVTEGWSIKRLIRSIVLSNTYQMSSAVQPAADELDPTNRLWHRTNVRRLEGEAIRDAMLVVSGSLDAQMFGPSVPVHITPFMQGRGKPNSSGPKDGDGRRSVYLEVRRNFLSPMMMAFDTPIPFNTVGRRNRSNVPAQALILMNDPFVIEQARKWAKNILAARGSFDDRVNKAYGAALARAATPAELAAAKDFFASQSAALHIAQEQSHADVRVWSDYCHVLFNVKEFVFID